MISFLEGQKVLNERPRFPKHTCRQTKLFKKCTQTVMWVSKLLIERSKTFRTSKAKSFLSTDTMRMPNR